MNQNDLKLFCTLRARAALAGVTLHRLDGDYGAPIYVASRWAMTKQLENLNEVEQWLVRVTGKQLETQV